MIKGGGQWKWPQMHFCWLTTNLLIKGFLLLEPVGGDKFVGIDLSLLHAISTSCSYNNWWRSATMNGTKRRDKKEGRCEWTHYFNDRKRLPMPVKKIRTTWPDKPRKKTPKTNLSSPRQQFERHAFPRPWALEFLIHCSWCCSPFCPLVFCANCLLVVLWNPTALFLFTGLFASKSALFGPRTNPTLGALSTYVELTKSVDMLQKLPYHTILCIW